MSVFLYAFFTLHNGDCVGSEDGECAFNGSYCKHGDIVNVNNIGPSGSPMGETRTCKGKGGGQSHSCRLMWNCAGSCQQRYIQVCNNMYTNYTSYTKLKCESAGAYRSSRAGNHRTNPVTCWLPNSEGVNGLADDVAWSSVNGGTCATVASLAAQGMSHSTSYHSCLKYEVTKKCISGIDATSTEVSTSLCSKYVQPESCVSSSPVDMTITSTSGGGGTPTSTCHPKPSGAGAQECSLVYFRGYGFTQWHDMNGMAYTDGGSQQSYSSETFTFNFSTNNGSTDGWHTICASAQTKSACEKIGYVKYYVGPAGYRTNVYKPATLPYNTNGNTEMFTNNCCEWSSNVY